MERGKAAEVRMSTLNQAVTHLENQLNALDLSCKDGSVCRVQETREIGYKLKDILNDFQYLKGKFSTLAFR